MSIVCNGSGALAPQVSQWTPACRAFTTGDGGYVGNAGAVTDDHHGGWTVESAVAIFTTLLGVSAVKHWSGG